MFSKKIIFNVDTCTAYDFLQTMRYIEKNFCIKNQNDIIAELKTLLDEEQETNKLNLFIDILVKKGQYYITPEVFRELRFLKSKSKDCVRINEIKKYFNLYNLDYKNVDKSQSFYQQAIRRSCIYRNRDISNPNDQALVDKILQNKTGDLDLKPMKNHLNANKEFADSIIMGETGITNGVLVTNNKEDFIGNKRKSVIRNYVASCLKYIFRKQRFSDEDFMGLAVDYVEYNKYFTKK